MRYLKLASAKNPSNDFIELNDLNGFLCTSFQSLGISRKLEFLQVNNRQFSVSNKPNFKRYSLTIEILSKYSEYEAKHRQLITFLDRNKKSGFRLYFKPYEGMEERYCLCDIETSARSEKMQPILLTVVQNSLWFGELKQVVTKQSEQDAGNLFEFSPTVIDGEEIYAVNFSLDENVEYPYGDGYYCVSFYNGATLTAKIINNSYNEIPLIIRIKGPVVNPSVSLLNSDGSLLQTTSISGVIDRGYYVELNSNIIDNGVWLVNEDSGEKYPYDEYVDIHNSPYFYLQNGEYIIKVQDEKNFCEAYVLYQEEYSE